MTGLGIAEIILLVAGILAMLGGDRFANSTLLFAGFGLFGAGFALGGLEAIITRRFGFARGYGLRSESYGGLAAMAWGVNFLLVGAWVIVLAGILYSGDEKAIIEHLVRRPGIVLLSAAVFLLGSGVANLIGSAELREGSTGEMLTNLLVYRLLPGLILVVLGLVVAGLAMMEILAPAAFDSMGGGFLEVLYGLPE